MVLLRWLIRILAFGVGVIALVFVGARFHDGPLGPIPGGPLASGELVEEPVTDWAFAKDIQEIELQLDSERRSRTVWVLVEGNQAFVPCSLSFPPGKSWYRQAALDGRATLRIDGRRYPVVLTKSEDPALAESLRAEAQRTYENMPPGESEVWVFQIDSRRPGA
jgi:hypothetical protein